MDTDRKAEKGKIERWRGETERQIGMETEKEMARKTKRAAEIGDGDIGDIDGLET